MGTPRNKLPSDQALELASKLAEAWLKEEKMECEFGAAPGARIKGRVALPGGKSKSAEIPTRVVKKLAGVE